MKALWIATVITIQVLRLVVGIFLFIAGLLWLQPDTSISVKIVGGLAFVIGLIYTFSFIGEAEKKLRASMEKQRQSVLSIPSGAKCLHKEGTFILTKCERRVTTVMGNSFQVYACDEHIGHVLMRFPNTEMHIKRFDPSIPEPVGVPQ